MKDGSLKSNQIDQSIYAQEYEGLFERLFNRSSIFNHVFVLVKNNVSQIITHQCRSQEGLGTPPKSFEPL